MFVCLNSFLMKVDSLPVYVNVAPVSCHGFFLWVWRKFRGGLGRCYYVECCGYFLLVGIQQVVVGRCLGSCIGI